MPSILIPTQPTPTQDLLESEPPTLTGPGMSEGAGDAAGEWALIRYVGNPIGEVISLGAAGLSMGRAPDNQVRLLEPEVSRYHVRLELVSQKGQAPIVLLSDLGSTNGTFVNGHQVQPGNGPVTLHHGDVLRMGTNAFKLKRLDELEKNYHQAVLAQATVDPLTRLCNRASVLAFLEKHTDLSRRYKRPLALILGDLDHFKEVNDQYGHAAGDLVLSRFGALAANRLRACDQAGRIGGEEFLVVLPETGGQEAMIAAEALRAAMADELLPIGPEGALRVTCCFGVASYSINDVDGGSLLARADMALYRAKAAGRNRVEFDGRL